MSKNKNQKDLDSLIEKTTSIGNSYHDKWEKSDSIEDAKMSITALKTSLIGHRTKIEYTKINEKL